MSFVIDRNLQMDYGEAAAVKMEDTLFFPSKLLPKLHIKIVISHDLLSPFFQVHFSSCFFLISLFRTKFGLLDQCVCVSSSRVTLIGGQLVDYREKRELLNLESMACRLVVILLT